MLLKKLFKSGAFAAMVISIVSCYPTLTSSIYNTRTEIVPQEDILILSVDNTMDTSVFKVGSAEFKSSELGMSCEYEDAVVKLKDIASKNGGNVVKITVLEEISSALIENCVTIKADIYYVEELEALRKAVELENQEIAKSKPVQSDTAEEDAVEAEEVVAIADTTAVSDTLVLEDTGEDVVEQTPTEPADSGEYATLYIYRPGIFGFAVTYDLHLDEQVLCKVKADWGTSVKIYEPGKYELWAKTEKKVAIPIEIEMGKEYFIRCTVNLGLLVGRPDFKIMDPAEGRAEYQDTVGEIVSMNNQAAAQ